MKMIYCPTCGKEQIFERRLGWGTFFAVLATAGLWLLAIPFYEIRCRGCGNLRPFYSPGNTKFPASSIAFMANVSNPSLKEIAKRKRLTLKEAESECIKLVKSGQLTRGRCEFIIGRKLTLEEVGDPTIKKCPFCAEYIKKEAIVCRYCRRNLIET